MFLSHSIISLGRHPLKVMNHFGIFGLFCAYFIGCIFWSLELKRHQIRKRQQNVPVVGHSRFTDSCSAYTYELTHLVRQIEREAHERTLNEILDQARRTHRSLNARLNATIQGMRNFDQKMRLIHQMSEPLMSGQGLKKGNPNPLYFISSKATGMSACIHKEVDDWPEFSV